MTSNRRVDGPTQEGPSPGAGDSFLMAGVLGGDTAALNKLMTRYDRLIRYTVFRLSQDRCQRDPEWLESIASATWAGFVRSIQRDSAEGVRSLPAYLVQIARNQVVSELRSTPAGRQPISLDASDKELPLASPLENVSDALARLEILDRLRHCLSELGPEDRVLASQLSAIVERRWKEASEALDMKESTLRSRWNRTLERLRACMERKTGDSFAPQGTSDDLSIRAADLRPR